MAQYSHLTIINGTPYDLIRGHHHSCQMDKWDSAFPETITSGASARVEVCFQNPLFGNKHDDGAEQVYLLNHGISSFEIKARSPDDGYHLWLDPTNLRNDGHAHPPIDLGWRENSELYLWIAGQNDGYITRAWWLSDEA
jgi:hypothetical protein